MGGAFDINFILYVVVALLLMLLPLLYYILLSTTTINNGIVLLFYFILYYLIFSWLYFCCVFTFCCYNSFILVCSILLFIVTFKSVRNSKCRLTDIHTHKIIYECLYLCQCVARKLLTTKVILHKSQRTFYVFPKITNKKIFLLNNEYNVSGSFIV